MERDGVASPKLRPTLPLLIKGVGWTPKPVRILCDDVKKKSDPALSGIEPGPCKRFPSSYLTPILECKSVARRLRRAKVDRIGCYVTVEGATWLE